MDVEKDILNKYYSIFDGLPKKGEGELRFGLSLVRISDIASQYYCEKKIELHQEHPLPPSEKMIKGESGHVAVTSLAEPITREGAIEIAIEEREKPICLYEFDIGWKYKDIPIIGKVDEAWFRSGNVDLVLERKFSDSLRIYPSYHVQAQLYCLGLEGMGFNTNNTGYRIMVLKRSCHDCKKLKDSSCPIFSTKESIYFCENGGAFAQVFKFNKDEVIKELNWAKGYWIKERDAVATKNKAKCKTCDYKKLCSSSLA